MGSVKQHRRVAQATINPNVAVEDVASFNSDGSVAGSAVVTTSGISTVGKSTSSPEPLAGTIVAVKFNNGNTATSPTLAFNGGTARAMQLGGTASASAKLVVAANGIALFYFDGTILHQVGAYT